MKRLGFDKKGLVADATSDSPAAQSFLALFDRLSVVAAGDATPMVVVTSAVSREGRSTVAANVARCAATTGRHRTLLVDADMRRPALGRLFDLKDGIGLLDVLAGTADADSAVHAVDGDRLFVVPAGRGKGSIALAAYGAKLAALVEQWSSQFDWIVADTAPILASSGAVVLGRRASGALLVVDAVRTRAPVVSRAAEHLRDGGVSIHGVVLNRRRHLIPRYAYRWLL